MALLTAVNVAPVFLIPSVLPYVLMGLATPVYSAVAMRGYMRHRETNAKLAKTRVCLFEQYYAGMADLGEAGRGVGRYAKQVRGVRSLVTLLYDVFQIYKNVTTSMTLGAVRLHGGQHDGHGTRPDVLDRLGLDPVRRGGTGVSRTIDDIASSSTRARRGAR
ncbi:hypothetical protein HPB51_022767 [Rhipicephalus microplus]|uniref:Uncharacterized protein n=1 Tax=Rhipicephalus microplus TaxID=6941 RepID=A0A9J6EBX5_RHIMP|nr:hypothetical protein HPB51_022767 [Rhipicephalus microplus]